MKEDPRGAGADAEARTGDTVGRPENVLDIAYGVLFQPARTVPRIAAGPKMGLGVLFFVVVTGLVALMNGIAAPASLPPEIPAGGFLAPFVVIVSLLMGLFGWVMGVAVLHLLAEFLGGSGSVRDLFATWGYIQLPRLFTVPAALLGAAVSPLVQGIMSLLIALWVLYLEVIAVRSIYRLSTGRAVLALIIPYVVLFAIVVVIVFALVFLILGMIQDYGGGFPLEGF